MIYSPSKEAVFCFCCKQGIYNCKLFSNENSKFCSVDGFKSWWKLNPKIREHESCLAHENVFTHWKELGIRLFKDKTIDIKHQILVKNAAEK
uniref:Zinc finger MYMtype protein 1like [Xenopus (Silurana) tropicalis] n=1 Tax=Lepeophtheirus salmonis TaxID=72036 RepID=A0A0K2U0U5_LEPSM